MGQLLDIFFPRWGLRPDYYLAVELKHNRYAINFEESGEVDFRRRMADGENRSTLTGPLIWLARPNCRYAYRRKENSRLVWRHWFVTFGGTEAEHWRERGLLDIPDQLKIRRPARFAEIFSRLFRELDRGDTDRGALILLELLFELREEAEQAPGGDVARVQELLEMLRKTPERDYDWEQLARDFHWSAAHFRRRFSQIAGLSPVAFLNRNRLDKAARLICDSPELPLKQAAELCGFDDVHYFGKLFRRRFGRPPGDYRRAYSI